MFTTVTATMTPVLAIGGVEPVVCVRKACLQATYVHTVHMYASTVV